MHEPPEAAGPELLAARAVTVPYGGQPDQFGQLWPGSGAGPHPVAVLVHGGYWRARYRLDLMNAMAARLSTVGFAVWNLEYRRVGSPGGGWPGTFEDVEAGLRVLPRVAAERGPDPDLDLDRVVLIGHSAGGQLALWLAARAARTVEPRGTVEPMPRPRLVVALAPVADLAEAHRRRLSGDAAVELLGATLAEAPDRYRQASPAALLPLGVPSLIVHGTHDRAVPYDLSVAFHAAARRSGDACELLTLPGSGHFEIIDPATPEWHLIEPHLHAVTG